MLTHIMHSVSVPYWGSLSSNANLYNERAFYKGFPSPTGVLYLLIDDVGGRRKQTSEKFPSPTGVLYLLIVPTQYPELKQFASFRPLLGFSIF